MWLKFTLNYIYLRLIDAIRRVLHKLHVFLGHRGLYKAADVVYILFMKLEGLFNNQLKKCHMILDIIDSRY